MVNWHFFFNSEFSVYIASASELLVNGIMEGEVINPALWRYELRGEGPVRN
jgi:hypothetical protein